MKMEVDCGKSRNCISSTGSLMSTMVVPALSRKVCVCDDFSGKVSSEEGFVFPEDGI